MLQRRNAGRRLKMAAKYKLCVQRRVLSASLAQDSDTSHRKRSRKTAALSVAVFLHLSVRCFDGNAAQVLYSRSCLIYMWGRRKAGVRIGTDEYGEYAPRFFAVLVLTVRCFYPHGLFLAAQSSHSFHSFHSFHSSLNRRPQAAVIPLQSYRLRRHDRSGLITTAAKKF